MKHLDLFSGIGLFSYAADHVWNLEHIFCEIEDWPYRFLKQEYPNARIERNIENFDGTEHAGRTFLLTAGVPCQPASVAGKRKGTEDDRWLWPEALRVLFESQAECAIFENPLGILTLENGLVFENLLLEMESQGYAVQPYIIPAGSIGAVHRRYRVWIVAHSTRSNDRRITREFQKTDEQQKTERQKERIAQFGGSDKRTSKNTFNPNGQRCKYEQKENRKAVQDKNGHSSPSEQSRNFKQRGIGESDSNDSDPSKQRLPGASCGELRSISSQARTFKGCAIDGISSKERDFWQRPWPEVAIESCIRGMDVSFTNGVYKAEKFKKGERIKRMKALGNTIQWEVAVAIMQAIKEIDK